jgi:hypothetical protein
MLTLMFFSLVCALVYIAITLAEIKRQVAALSSRAPAMTTA